MLVNKKWRKIIMMKCKWAGDQNDEYCKNCDGGTMKVDGNSIS